MMVWDQDGLMLGWFDTPKKSSDFSEKVLNMVLTNGLGFGIMQSAFDRKNAPRQKPRSANVYFIS
jgi:hypothetical protein